ncbi:MAG: RnfABCDGE type electron transport complex subunit B [Desulfosudaceae bacterium]
MTNAVFVLAGLGTVIGICLAAASRIFYVYVDPKVEAVDEALPGANCGGCGYPGCTANAEAIVAGESPPTSCVAGGEDLAETIAGLLGMTVEAKEPDIAEPGCTYGLAEADTKYRYDGIPDCRAAVLLAGGMKTCEIGCLGLGTCVRACPFDALKMSDHGLPVVDKEKCTGCGTCERVCPKHIIKLSSVTRRILREYTVDDCTTPCQRACPAGINIREYIKQITLGHYPQAISVIKERLPFPSVIGRICPRFCEMECRRNLVDEPVAINGLKRFVADYEEKHGRALPFMAPSTDRKVAVIGGGVEGLSAAYFSARLGHSPLVLEASDSFGGLLRKAIARERLPLEILDYDIGAMKEMGIKMQTNTIACRDFSIDSLLVDGYQAVFLATGGWDSWQASENKDNLRKPLLSFGLLIDLFNKQSPAVTCGEQVVIIGASSVAREAVAKCGQAGARRITFLINSDPADMDLPALEDDGAEIIFNAAADRLIGTGRALESVVYTDTTTGTSHTVPAQTILFAAGRFPELIFYRQDAETAESPAEIQETTPVAWQAVPVYKNPVFGDQPGLLAKGDPVADIDAAIKAIGAGRRAAAAMHMIMYGDPMCLPDTVLTRHTLIQSVSSLDGVSKLPRNLMPLRSQEEIEQGLELEAGFSERIARDEAGRCLQCGLICYEHR